MTLLTVDEGRDLMVFCRGHAVATCCGEMLIVGQVRAKSGLFAGTRCAPVLS
jgi:hypothetical protein